MLTISRRQEDLLNAIQAGADGYILKNAEPEELYNAIISTSKGHSVLSPEITSKVMDVVRKASSLGNPDFDITSREMDVLALLHKKQTNPQISDQLNISENTVKTHVRNLMEKLNVTSRSEAVRKALTEGILIGSPYFFISGVRNNERFKCKWTTMSKTETVFCAQCGNMMEQTLVGGRIRPKCPDCGFVLYKNPIPGAGVLVEMDGGGALIRRGHDPHRGRWALPAGFIEADESIEEAAIRECKEETGLDVELIEIFHVDLFPNDPTPQSGIIIFYRAKPISGQLAPGDDACETGIFAPNQLPFNVAFRTHRAALSRWAGLHGEVAGFASPKDEVYPLAPNLLIRRAQFEDENAIIDLLTMIPADHD